METPRLSQLITPWLTDRAADNRRPQGLASYERESWRFIRFVKDPPVDRVGTPDVRRYKVACAQRTSAGTVRHRLTVVRALFTWAVDVGYRADNPALKVPHPKVEPPPPDPLSRAELRHLLAICDDATKCRASLWRRNRRAVFLMLYAGLRLSETAGIQRRDVDLERAQLVVRPEVAKGGKLRIVPLCDELVDELVLQPPGVPTDYVVNHGDAEHQAHRGLGRKSLAHIFERWLPKYGLDIHAHQLRKTFATELYLRGEDIVTIQRLLGHSDPKTTMRYIAASSEKERAAVAKLRFREP